MENAEALSRLELRPTNRRTEFHVQGLKGIHNFIGTELVALAAEFAQERRGQVGADDVPRLTAQRSTGVVGLCFLQYPHFPSLSPQEFSDA